MIYTTHAPFQFGTRVQLAHQGGYIPIGFFQLWHADSKILKYPEGHTDAGREDSHFATLWPRGKRSLIPEILFCYHLESEAAVMGAELERADDEAVLESTERGSKPPMTISNYQI